MGIFYCLSQPPSKSASLLSSFFFFGGGGEQKKRSRCFLFLLLLLLLLLLLFVAVVSYCTRIGKEGGGKLCNVYVYRSIVRGNRVSVNIVSYLNKY